MSPKIDRNTLARSMETGFKAKNSLPTVKNKEYQVRNSSKITSSSKMSVLELEIPEKKTDKSDTVCPTKIIVLALARDHRGIRAKMLAETLHKRYPDDYHKPLVKFFHDIGWRDTLNRLRKASKKWDYMAPVIVFVNKQLIGDDDDFNLFIRQKHFLLADPKRIIAFRNMTLLDKLRMDPLKTYVYFDISIDYRPCGRMIFQIEEDTMPESTKEFLMLCCSQKIPLPPGQLKRSRFAGSLIKRIVRDGWIRIDTINDERTYAKGKYEKSALTHNRRGTLSLNVGPRGWLSSHIVITLDQHPWMDKLYRAIGVLIDGEHVLHMLENVDTTYENPNIDVVITDNGILYSPSLMTTEEFLNPEIKEASEKLQCFKNEYKMVLAAYVNTVQCKDPDVKVEPKISLEEEKGENEPDDEIDVNQSSFVPASQASLLASKSRITGFNASQSKVAMWSRSERLSLGGDPSFREISSKRASALPSFGSELMLIGSKASVQAQESVKSLRPRNRAKSSTMVDLKRSKTIVSSVKSQPGKLAEEEDEEEVGEEAEVKPQLSEPDIEYTYIVPKEMVDMRVAYKMFGDGKRPEQFQKIGLKLSTKDQFEVDGLGKTDKPLENRTFAYDEPHQTIDKDESNYYEISKKAMAQVTPKLLLAWAQGIDDDIEVVDIQKAVNELLNTVMQEATNELDREGQPLDTVSMEDTCERFRKCLLSLPTQLLQMLHQEMHDIFERQDHGTQPLTVTGESTSKVELTSDLTNKTKAVSEDVISGIMFSLIDFTKRMIESSTELVPSMKNLDFVKSIIDEVILEKVHNFMNKKREKDKRFKQKLPYEFFSPGDPKAPYMKRLRQAKGGIGYYLDVDQLPRSISEMSTANLQYFSEISAKQLPVHIKDPQKQPSEIGE